MFSAGDDGDDDDPYASVDISAGLKRQKKAEKNAAAKAREAELHKKREELEVSKTNSKLTRQASLTPLMPFQCHSQLEITSAAPQHDLRGASREYPEGSRLRGEAEADCPQDVRL